jgi:hypothetical protein
MGVVAAMVVIVTITTIIITIARWTKKILAEEKTMRDDDGR